MHMPSITMPKWLVAAANLKGKGTNRIFLLGKHPLAEIYADNCASMGIDAVWLRDRKCILGTDEQMKHVGLLIIFGGGGATFLKKYSSELKSKLLGLPIAEVFDNSLSSADEPFRITTAPVRIYDDENSYKLLLEMERIIFNTHSEISFARCSKIQ